jgi:hypothetical protein
MKPALNALAVAQRRNELLGREAKVHKVAETATVALAIFVLSAAGFAEVRDGREFGV